MTDAVQPAGILCPRCGCAWLRVTNTWKMRTGHIRRRRKCRHCDKTIYTFEKCGTPANGGGKGRA